MKTLTKWLLIILLGVLAWLITSCGNTKQLSNWQLIGNDNYTIVEVCRDTISVNKLDSICVSNNIHSSLKKWSVMKYYNSKEDYMRQWIYTRGKDTVYTITDLNDKYIFTLRVNVPNIK